MLGNFLEFSIGVAEVGKALQFYRSIGFQDLPTGDFITTPYAALWDGGIVVGLHQAEAPVGLRFVRPSLREHLPVLKRLKIEIDSAELGDDAFNRLAFTDNAGHRVELVEARTCSLAERDPASVSACGRFAEISLPTHSIDESAAFWTALGFRLEAADDAPYDRIRLTGFGCTLGFHQANFLPGLSFLAGNFRARTEFLRAQNVPLKTVQAPRLGGGEAVRIDTAGGAPVYLHAAPD